MSLRPLKDLKILFIEDDPNNQQLVCWILEDAGCSVVCANSAEEGLELIESNNFHLVLMDISLPGMNGKQATAKIRNSPHLASLPILAVTAHTDAAEVQSILNSGANGVINKPVDESLLLQKISIFIQTDMEP